MRSRPVRALFALAILFTIAGPGLAAADVIISEMCDPRYEYLTDRFIEIYNAGTSSVDLTGWTLVAVGNNVDIFTWNLSGTIAPGQALVAGDQTTVVSFQVDFAEEAWSSNTMNWNGKVGDGARLVNASSTIVDLAVVPGTVFENQDLVRNSNIVTGNTAFTASEWTATPVDSPTQASPGTHSTDPPVASGPQITGIAIAPASPLPEDSVDVSATVVDTSAATITSVTLNWGTAPGSLPHPVSMTLDSGDTYRTVTAIPPQTAGTTVFFEIVALNTAGGTTTSDEQSYGLPVEATIHAIQGEVASSPFDGQTVITSGVVTASYPSFFVLQSGTGAWDGIWVDDPSTPARGDTVRVRARVDESTGNTVLTDAQILNTGAGVLPAAVAVTTAQAASEPYEGVLVSITSADCTDPALGGGEWEADDGSAPVRINDLGYAFSPTLGTTYGITGPVRYDSGRFKLEPRDAADVAFLADTFAPILSGAAVQSETSVLVTFSEAVDEFSAETPVFYSIPGLSISAAQQPVSDGDQVLLTVSTMSSASYTLTVDGVEDLFGNVMSAVARSYDFYDNDIPPGYYDSVAGLSGVALQSGLHLIIDNHNAQSYSSSWTSFQTTDDKPNGKVWDMYSDVPGGTPAYEFTFVVDQDQGVGGTSEGDVYNREHSWPTAWYGGGLPMYSDLFLLYPTDKYINNQRGSLPYGEVTSPTWTSSNGSKLGACSYPGYSGVVFEPIDAFKGDFARSYFYMSTRYYNEDGGWPGSDMTSGSQLLPWALDMMLQWHSDDPVSLKELERNSTVYGIQSNRNPFIDHPEYVELAFGAPTSTGEPSFRTTPRLLLNTPNPFTASTTIRFEVPHAQDGRLVVFDVQGRQVAVLASGSFEAGMHIAEWDGMTLQGRIAGAGIYFAHLRTAGFAATRRLIRLR